MNVLLKPTEYAGHLRTGIPQGKWARGPGVPYRPSYIDATILRWAARIADRDLLEFWRARSETEQADWYDLILAELAPVVSQCADRRFVDGDYT